MKTVGYLQLPPRKSKVPSTQELLRVLGSTRTLLVGPPTYSRGRLTNFLVTRPLSWTPPVTPPLSSSALLSFPHLPSLPLSCLFPPPLPPPPLPFPLLFYHLSLLLPPSSPRPRFHAHGRKESVPESGVSLLTGTQTAGHYRRGDGVNRCVRTQS